MITSPRLRKLLGLPQIEKLGEALNESSRTFNGRGLSTGEVLLGLVIASLPLASFFVRNISSRVDITTVFVGVATCLAILFRVTRRIPFLKVADWRRDLSLTHTAFALGCIPTVIMIWLDPHSLHHLSSAKKDAATAVPMAHPTSYALALFVLKVSVWAGLTEEFIFRGLLISALRRWSIFKTQRVRDLIAVTVSALMFGLSHLPIWGPSLSLALVGLGLGLGAAYIAIGEAILPLVLYHIIFDILSLTAAFYLYRM